ncbi:DinB family protein [Paenibacillus lignilyticus]|uniref:DinB family protein n=1 Tax=Paenibacillus lignilyticus TaxID=1172615 RepID=A0ABS5C9D6_9BACL|nr:DinB family protein [Paenibacillus lignilyticus]MBP3962618.1 DinB family protein [Paenibacillus lignilyticus]
MEEKLRYQNYEFSRSYFLAMIEKLDERMMDIQPKGFNNNIRWHIGHVLTISESFIFGDLQNLPANYKELFYTGTKPDDWNRDVTSLQLLIKQLKEQIDRINRIPEEQLQNPQDTYKAFGMKTIGELITFTFAHEVFHLGQIHAMKLLLQRSTQ